LGVHAQHGVYFWDVVITGDSYQLPSNGSFFLFWYGEDGMDLYAFVPLYSMDVISQECNGFTPVGHARLFLTECETHGRQVSFDLVFIVYGFLLCAIDQNDKVVGVSGIPQLRMMSVVIQGCMPSFLFQLF